MSRPQVLISGEIHGDERVVSFSSRYNVHKTRSTYNPTLPYFPYLFQGPQVTVVLSQLLGWSAECVIRKDRERCTTLDQMQISVAQRTWLAFLSTRRETIVVPTANCMGYMKGVRSDGGVDPNRDYPYSRRDSRCLQSSSAKLFKALMDTSLVQVVVTFHGGMVALGYEWGSRNHLRPKDASPDESAHRSIAELMRDYGGSFQNEQPYPGKMLSI